MTTAAEAGVLASTRKGLLIGHSSDGRTRWDWSDLLFGGWIIDYTMRDPRAGTIWCAANHWQWGPRLRRSDDGGHTWRETGIPTFTDGERSLEGVWTIEAGAEDGVLYAGVMPAALFVSRDDGETWTELESLTNHPTNTNWEPGNAGLMFHHMGVDAQDPGRLVVSGSATGTYASYDGGDTWHQRNGGIRSDNLPPDMQDMAPCIHSMHAHPKQRGRLWQQGHFGQYRSDDDGEHWVEVGHDLPGDFGFASAIDPNDPDVCYYIPLDFDQARMPRRGALKLYRTSDAGASWRELSQGLPQENFHQAVYRHALGQDGGDPLGLYMGSSGGELYGSTDAGDTWTLMREHLAPITAVRAWTLDSA